MITPFVSEEVYQRWRAYLEAKTSLRGFHRGSISAGLGRALGNTMDDAYYQMTRAVGFFNLLRLKGDRLDKRIRDFYGMPGRYGATYAVGPGVFHREVVDGGVELDEEIVIDEGTLVVVPETTMSAALRFYTTEAALIPADSWLSNVVNIRSEGTGWDYNTSAGLVTTTDPKIPGVERFENTYDITGGRPQETDAEVIARAQRWIQSLSCGTIPALIQAAVNTEYDGERITSCSIHEQDTPGRAIAYLDNGFGVPSTNIMTLVQKKFDGDVTDIGSYFGTRAGGVRVTAKRSTIQWLTATATIEFKSTAIGLNRSQTITKVRNAIVGYINSLWSGETVAYEWALVAALQADPDFVAGIDILINDGTDDITVAEHTVPKIRSTDCVVSG